MTTTNNSDNNKEIKLNSLIFTDISKYLLYDNESFSTVLEYSLLSKFTFKIFQSLLSSPSHEFKYKLGTFLKYIGIGNNKKHDKTNNNDETDNYKLKLIQYKEIEILRISSLQHSIKKRKLGPNEQIKNLFMEKCKNLKQVILLDYIDAITVICNDFTCNGFFKVMKLSNYFSHDNIPGSFDGDEYIDYNVPPEEIEYSFEYLGKYNPLKIKLKTCSGDLELNIKKMGNILNCKSIEKINFSQATTPYQFLKKSLDSKNPLIKSLTVRLHPFYEYDDEEFGNSSTNPSFKLIEILNSNGSSSDIDNGNGNDNDNGNGNGNGNNIIQKHLNKLRLRKSPFEDRFNGWNDNEGLTKLLNILKNNANCKITRLGLEVFNIKHSNLLLPLIEMTNISTIYCDTLNLKVWLNHCNQNPNIKKLVHIENSFELPLLVSAIFKEFFQNNKSSLQIIKHVGESTNPFKSSSQYNKNENLKLKLVYK